MFGAEMNTPCSLCLKLMSSYITHTVDVGKFYAPVSSIFSID
jgi:hypothetical protein